MSGFTEYYVPAGFGEAEFTEKKSKFIGRVWRVKSDEEAQAKINEMREKHRDATHNVYAYIIRSGALMRYSDDGEPQGTSGLPVLGVFRNAGIYDVCCVVTRYFGGTLLGTGGLVRAYSHTASLALERAGISIVRKCLRALIACPYSIYDSILREIELIGASVEDTKYGEDIEMTVLIPEDSGETFNNRLRELSAGKVSAEILREEFIAMPLKKRDETNPRP
ncbi:MAG: YigZ family protein [Clostridiales bacterium]|jgi:uncharacterized YigZ family protein|nr:YigZ family protein [Clostridiales bacterium]